MAAPFCREDASVLRTSVCGTRHPERRQLRSALSQHHDGVPEWPAPRTSTRPACVTRDRGRVVPPHWRPHGPQRLPPASASIQTARSDFLREVRQIWKVCDVSNRRAGTPKTHRRPWLANLFRAAHRWTTTSGTCHRPRDESARGDRSEATSPGPHPGHR